jgi:ABC-2 type transport system ATP-binding protein
VEPSLRIAEMGEADAAGFRRYTFAADRHDELGEALLRVLAGGPAFRVRSLGRTHASLEDVFLAATRRSWDARLPDKPVNGDSRAPLPKF